MHEETSRNRGPSRPCRFFARASRPGKAKARGDIFEKFIVRGPKGELVLFTKHESERQRACAASRAKGCRRQLKKTSRSAVPLLHFTKRSAGGALGASTGPRKALTWQAAVLHRWKASSGRVPADRTSARYDCRDNASFPTDTACYIPLPFICR